MGGADGWQNRKEGVRACGGDRARGECIGQRAHARSRRDSRGCTWWWFRWWFRTDNWETYRALQRDNDDDAEDAHDGDDDDDHDGEARTIEDGSRMLLTPAIGSGGARHGGMLQPIFGLAVRLCLLAHSQHSLQSQQVCLFSLQITTCLFLSLPRTHAACSERKMRVMRVHELLRVLSGGPHGPNSDLSTSSPPLRASLSPLSSD
eukprot:3934853-Rhodomonas_salina.3